MREREEEPAWDGTSHWAIPESWAPSGPSAWAGNSCALSDRVSGGVCGWVGALRTGCPSLPGPGSMAGLEQQASRFIFSASARLWTAGHDGADRGRGAGPREQVALAGQPALRHHPHLRGHADRRPVGAHRCPLLLCVSARARGRGCCRVRVTGRADGRLASFPRRPGSEAAPRPRGRWPWPRCAVHARPPECGWHWS